MEEAVQEEERCYDANASNCKHPNAIFVPVIYEYIDTPGRCVQVLCADASWARLLFQILASVSITFIQILQAAPACTALIQHLILWKDDRLRAIHHLYMLVLWPESKLVHFVLKLDAAAAGASPLSQLLIHKRIHSVFLNEIDYTEAFCYC